MAGSPDLTLQAFRPERVVGVGVGGMVMVMAVIMIVVVVMNMLVIMVGMVMIVTVGPMLAGAGAFARAQGAAGDDALDVMVVALLGTADIGLEAQHLGAVLAQAAVHGG